MNNPLFQMAWTLRDLSFLYSTDSNVRYSVQSAQGWYLFDVHGTFDGSGRKKEFPDGRIIRPEWVPGAARLVRAAPELKVALEGMLEMHDLMMKKVNHKESFYDAQTLAAMNAAPLLARAALDSIENYEVPK